MKRLTVFAVLLLASHAQAGELKLDLYGKGMAGNRIRVAVYSASAPEQFPFGNKFYLGIVGEAAGDRFTVSVADLLPGSYAVAAYVDSKDNGRQDQNFLGVPTELYGFSNNARGKFGVPDFAAAGFAIGERAVSLSIHLH
ncbi:MAG: DUF2141 domain-containing protein [Gallionella sp.]|nr:DUF2141 domain-containing protein [Gallionella sp.]